MGFKGIKRKLIRLVGLVGVAGGCCLDLENFKPTGYDYPIYPAVAYSDYPYLTGENGERILVDPAFATGEPNGQEAVLGYSERAGSRSMFLFYGSPLGKNLKVNLRGGENDVDCEIGLSYDYFSGGDVIDTRRIQVARFNLVKEEVRQETYNIEGMLAEFERMKLNDSGIITSEIDRVEIRNYGTGDLFIESAESY